MKAIVLHGPRDFRVESVPDAGLRGDRDAVVRVTRASICGSDLHLYHGLVPTVPGTITGHECVGVVEEVGSEVRRFRRGDRVLVPAVAGCGDCEACRRDYPVGCTVWPNKVFGILPDLPGGQAEAITIPHADVNLRPMPPDLGEEQALLLTDILPTGYYAAVNASVQPGSTVVVLGCGPVGLCAVMSAGLYSPARIIAVDRVPERLRLAKALGAIPVDAGAEDPRTVVLEQTHGEGAEAVIEAVGVAETVHLAFELARVGGSVSVVGVLMKNDFPFPLGTAFLKDLTFRVGLVNVRRYLPTLIPLVRSGRLDPVQLVTHRLPLAEGAQAYALFDERREGCLKVVLAP